MQWSGRGRVINDEKVISEKDSASGIFLVNLWQLVYFLMCVLITFSSLGQTMVVSMAV